MGRQRSPRWRAVVVGLTAAVLVLVVGVLLLRLGSDGASDADRPAATSRDNTAANASRAAGDPHPGAGEAEASGGFSRDESGAVAAAISYTAASQRWLYLSDDEIAESVAEIAVPQSVDRLTAEVVDETRMAREELAESAGPVWWLVQPLAWQVESYSQDEARVAVWTVTVLSAAGVALPQSEWMTLTLELEWVSGDWRVHAVRDRPGPTPMTGPRDEPWNPERFDDALDGFTRLGGESAP